MRAAGRVRRQAKVLSYSDKNSMIQTALLFETVEEIYLRVLRELKPRTKPARIVVRFRPYVNVDSNIQLQEGHQCIEVKISDQLEGAPAPVQEALAQILLRKLYRKPIPKKYNHRYRMFLNRADMRRRSLLIRQMRGRKQMRSPQGHAYDLEEIFGELNARFFRRAAWSPPAELEPAAAQGVSLAILIRRTTRLSSAGFSTTRRRRASWWNTFSTTRCCT